MSTPPVDVPAAGLSSSEAAARRHHDGPNRLPSPARTPAWRLLVAQLLHFFALLLWGAAALALVAGLPTLAIAIVVVVVVNGVFAHVQERRAEHAAESLRDLLPQRVTVVRDGVVVTADAVDLVRGDLVVLAAGDRVPADLRVVEAHGASLDTSTLTGESVAEAVDEGALVHAGTFVVEGECRATVSATGSDTRLAEIATLTRARRRPRSPLEQELHRLVRTIATIAVSVGGAFFVTTLLVDTPPRDGFVFAIGVTVALVPEGLLPTVTLSLAIGAQRMARRNALVRHLEAVETLGSTTFVCTDKTGTLTHNEMQVVEVWTPEGTARVRGEGYAPDAEVATDGAALAAARLASIAGTRCSNGRVASRGGGWVAVGDPMEAAIHALALRLGADERTLADTEDPVRRRFPFDARRRRMSVVTVGAVYVKGAPDSVVPLCRPVGGTEAAISGLTGRGLRVLAVARGRPPGGPDAPSAPGQVEQDLELLALLGLEDPPRAAAPDAIRSCREFGVRVAMITGDHPETAAAIAAEVGLLLPDAPVVIGADLPVDDDALGALVDRDGAVVARATPEDKLRVARVLQARGHVVAMTGDGVNDGPALQQADIGVAMGLHGSDVAREASDLVLLDDDFSTIVAAIEDGRATYANMRRFLTYHLTDNVAELAPLVVWAGSGTRFPLALGVVQILALDLATDTASAVALGAEPPAQDSATGRPAGGRLFDRLVARRAFGLLGPTEAVFGLGAFVASLSASGWRPGDEFPTGAALLTASGATFLAVVVAQVANAFACRSTTQPVWALDWRANPMLVVAVVVGLALAVVLLAVPPLASGLDHAWPSWAGLAVALLAAPTLLAVDALDKAVRVPGRAERRRPVGRPPARTR